ncbi:extracellular solute-binding protein [Paenibacillus sp. FSL H7-0756]|uniref:extracellular solute-binding protein n=1 Tax=Paenibacillus sp. FSL H7-0756 TaxID=2954738 RepID=UPI0030F99205
MITSFTKTKKWIAVAGIASMSISMLAACGNKETTSAAVNTNEEKPLELSVMMIQQLAEPPKNDSPILQKIQEETHTKLDITWVPASSYDDKVSATIAAGTMPDLLLIRRNKESAMLQAQNAGVFWDLAPYLKDTKNLKNMSEVSKNNATIDGQLFGIPRERVLARYGMIFRKDWLDQLGLQPPKSVDDIYTIAKAFTENDPDQNGKNDTFGIQEDSTMELLKQLAVYSGGANGWGLKDGKIIPDFMYPDFKASLDLYKKMIDEKLIGADFPIAKKYEYFNQEKAGIYFAVLDDAIVRHTDLMKQNPAVVVDIAQNFEGPQGERARATLGYDNILAIPKSSVPDEGKLKQIIAFLDQLGEEPLQSLLMYGVEGTDYTVEDNQAVIIAGSSGSGDWKNFKWDDPYAGITPKETEIEAKVKNTIISNSGIAVIDYSAGLISATNTDKGSELRKAITDAQVRYVLGELDDKGWEDAIAKWRSSGGDQIIEEFTANYNETASK